MIPVLWTGSPILTDRLMAVVGCCLASVVVLAALGLPITPDLDVFGATAVLLAGLLRLLGRLRLLYGRRLRFCSTSGECEGQRGSGDERDRSQEAL